MKFQSVKDRLRRISKKELLALQVIANSSNGIATTSEMSEVLYGHVDASTGTAGQAIGGVITAVSRIKGEEGQLLKVVGKDKFGTRLQLNADVISKEELKELVEEILATWK